MGTTVCLHMFVIFVCLITVVSYCAIFMAMTTTLTFQDNTVKPVTERLHSGVYWS